MFSQEIKTTCTLFSKEVHDCNYFFFTTRKTKGIDNFSATLQIKCNEKQE
jgi:hypothetical protein